MTVSIPALIAAWDAQNDCHDPEATVLAGDALRAALESLSAPSGDTSELENIQRVMDEADRGVVEADVWGRFASNEARARALVAAGYSCRPSPVTREALGKLIWDTSRADEGSISATGANIIADAILARFSLPEPAEVEWEYAECLLLGDNPDVYEVHKGPWSEPRPVDEGYYLMKRSVARGAWLPVEEGTK